MRARADPEGVLHVRGPAVGKVEVLGEEADESDREWLNTEERVRVQTNGCLKYLL
jgi:hypothetical protein